MSTTAYRYRYNDKEQLSRFSGRYDYGFRMYDAGVGRFLSVDPLKKKYPELTPFQFASNRPIDGVDLDGLDLDGLEYQNFMSFYKNPLSLKEKYASDKDSQKQYYDVTIRNSKLNANDIYNRFYNNPNSVLGNAEAKFSFVQQSSKGHVSVGDILSIDLPGPVFASHVKVINTKVDEDNIKQIRSLFKL